MTAATEQRILFRDKTLNVFRSIEEAFGINPKIPLIQAAEESNWGLSLLATAGNNIFSLTPGAAWLSFKNGTGKEEDVPRWSSLGIETVHLVGTEYHKLPPEKIRYWEFNGDIVEKKPDGKGGSVLKIDRHYRKYATWEESAWDWARKIAKTPMYRFAYEASKPGDIIAYATAVARVGYANDPDYVNKLFQYGRAVAALPGAST